MSHPTVLLVGHHADFAPIYAPALRQAGYRVVILQPGENVVTATDDTAPDVVVAEGPAILPGGERLADVLRRDPRTSSAWLVSITAWVTEHDVENERQGGAARVLTMPVAPMALVTEVEALLRRQA